MSDAGLEQSPPPPGPARTTSVFGYQLLGRARTWEPPPTPIRRPAACQRAPSDPPGRSAPRPRSPRDCTSPTSSPSTTSARSTGSSTSTCGSWRARPGAPPHRGACLPGAGHRHAGRHGAGRRTHGRARAPRHQPGTCWSVRSEATCPPTSSRRGLRHAGALDGQHLLRLAHLHRTRSVVDYVAPDASARHGDRRADIWWCVLDEALTRRSVPEGLPAIITTTGGLVGLAPSSHAPWPDPDDRCWRWPSAGGAHRRRRTPARFRVARGARRRGAGGRITTHRHRLHHHRPRPHQPPATPHGDTGDRNVVLIGGGTP